MSVDDLENRVKVLYQSQPHLAAVLLLDTSSSMAGLNIRQLNEGMQTLKEEISNDELARKRVELAVVTFGNGGVNVINDFSAIENFKPPTLVADGGTPMGEAIIKAIDLVESRKKDYKKEGVDHFRPWIFMITDGEPNMRPGDSMWNTVVKKVHDGETNRKFSFFVVGVDSANMDLLKQIAPPARVPLRLKEGMWKKMFAWLSNSQREDSQQNPGDQISLENPTGPTGWAIIPIENTNVEETVKGKIEEVAKDSNERFSHRNLGWQEIL